MPVSDDATSNTIAPVRFANLEQLSRVTTTDSLQCRRETGQVGDGGENPTLRQAATVDKNTSGSFR